MGFGLLCLLAIVAACLAQEEIKVFIGSKVTIPCNVENGFSRCSWQNGKVFLTTDEPSLYKSGYRIRSDLPTEKCDLEIQVVKEEDAGQWICKRSILSTPGTVVVQLTVLGAAGKEAIMEAKKGSQIRLPCHVGWGGRCTWTKGDLSFNSDVPPLDKEGYSIVKDVVREQCDLVIKKVTEQDGGQWTCTWQSMGPPEKVHVSLIVQDAPYRPSTISLTNPEFMSKATNQINSSAVNLTCTFTNENIAPISLKWTVNGNRLKPTQDTVISKLDDIIAASSTLFLNLSSAEESPEAKSVTCTGVHLSGEYSVTKTFQKIYATTFVRLRELNTTSDNSRKTLHCEANGIPQPNYMIKMVSPTKSVFAGQNRTVTENGDYVCVATYQDAQPLQSAKVTINFDAAPIDEITANQGFTVKLPCKLQNGFSRCSWTNGNVTLNTDVPHLYPIGYEIVKNSTTDNCDLEILEIKETDEGLWTCTRPLHRPINLTVHLTVLDKDVSIITYPTTLSTTNEETVVNHNFIWNIAVIIIGKPKVERLKLSTGLMIGIVVISFLIVLTGGYLACFVLKKRGIVKYAGSRVWHSENLESKGREVVVEPVKVIEVKSKENV